MVLFTNIVLYPKNKNAKIFSDMPESSCLRKMYRYCEKNGWSCPYL